MLQQIVDASLRVFEQHVRHVAAEAMPDEDAHDHRFLDVRRHRIGGDLPAADAQPVGQIEQRIARVDAILDHPGDRREAGLAVAVEEQFERPQFADLPADVLRVVVAVLLDSRV